MIFTVNHKRLAAGRVRLLVVRPSTPICPSHWTLTKGSGMNFRGLILVFFAAISFGCKSTRPFDTVSTDDIQELEEFRESHPEIAARARPQQSVLTGFSRSPAEPQRAARSYSSRPC